MIIPGKIVFIRLFDYEDNKSYIIYLVNPKINLIPFTLLLGLNFKS